MTKYKRNSKQTTGSTGATGTDNNECESTLFSLHFPAIPVVRFLFEAFEFFYLDLFRISCFEFWI
jgi:hypothetical protein